MRVKHRNMALLSATVLVIGGGVLAATTMRTQPAGGDPLPPGFSRDANTGALVVTAPPAVQFQPEQNKNRVVELTSNLSVGSLSLDQAGYVKAFTVNSRLGDYPDGTVLICARSRSTPTVRSTRWCSPRMPWTSAATSRS